MLNTGTNAPDFELPNQHRQNVKLSDFRGSAIFVIDKKGVIAWAARYDIPQQPPQAELLRVLKAL